MADFNAIRFQPARPLLKEVSADRLNTILAEIKRNKPVGERGITVRQSGDRTYIGLAKNFDTRTTAELHPFYITSAPHPSAENQYIVTVRPGTVNQVLPSNNFSGANLREFVVSGNTIQHVNLNAVSDGSQIVSCQLATSSSPPSGQNAALYALPTSVSFLIGVVFNSTVYQIIKTNIAVTGSELYRRAKSSPAPGEVAFDIYYTWK